MQCSATTSPMRIALATVCLLMAAVGGAQPVPSRAVDATGIAVHLKTAVANTTILLEQAEARQRAVRSRLEAAETASARELWGLGAGSGRRGAGPKYRHALAAAKADCERSRDEIDNYSRRAALEQIARTLPNE